MKPSLNAALIVSLINHVSSKFCAHLASVCLYGIVRLHYTDTEIWYIMKPGFGIDGEESISTGRVTVVWWP